VTVTLRYWVTRAESLAEWRQEELEGFTRFAEKAQRMTMDEFRTDPGLRFKTHKGPAKGRGFARPGDLSEDQVLSEVRVGRAARVHGVVEGDMFHVVWLDRNHAVFP
jgi:hypothetical protein